VQVRSDQLETRLSAIYRRLGSIAAAEARTEWLSPELYAGDHFPKKERLIREAESILQEMAASIAKESV
jgi:hypothetical protein